MALRFLLIDILPVLAPLLLYVLAKTEATWFRPFMNDLARVLGAIPVIGSRLASQVRAIESNLRHYLGTAVLAAERPIVKWLQALRTFVSQLFYTATNTAVEVGRAVEQLARLLEHEILVPAKVTVKRLSRTVYRIDKKTAAKITAALAAVGALPTAVLQPAIRGVEGEIADLRDYVNRKANRLAKSIDHEARKVALGALAAGLTWAAIRRLKLGWLKCAGTNRVGKSLCTNTGIIEALYADAIIAFAVTDLCRFSTGMEQVAEAIRPGMLAWVDVEHALLNCPRADYPKDLPHFLSSPTPVFDAVAL